MRTVDEIIQNYNPIWVKGSRDRGKKRDFAEFYYGPLFNFQIEGSKGGRFTKKRVKK